jgi:hypothetical protein
MENAVRLSDRDTHRFFSKIKSFPDGKCWLWDCYESGSGYGALSIKGKMHGAHRLAWIAFHGPIPTKACVCHKCDNPKCINPHHLFLGTHKDNMVDMCSKGRQNMQKKTHCPQGHEYTLDNIFPAADNRRRCRICKREQDRVNQLKYYYQKKELANA